MIRARRLQDGCKEANWSSVFSEELKGFINPTTSVDAVLKNF